MKSQRIRKTITLMFALIILSFPLISQSGRGSGRVAGSIKNESGNPLEKVTITIIKISSEEFKLNTRSNKKGEWGIFGFASGRFNFYAEKEGYETMKKTIKLTSLGRNSFMDIVLKKESANQEKVDNTEKTDKAVIIKKGNKFFKDKKYAEALPFFKDFVIKYPENYKVAINLGNCYMELKNYKGAVEAFKRVIEGYKKDIPDFKGNEDVALIFSNIGDAYTGLQDLEKAALNYKKSIESSSLPNVAIVFRLAEIMFNRGKTDDAIKYYKLSITLKPEQALYYSKLGYAYLNKGDIKQSIQYFEKFIKMAPKDPQSSSLRSLINDLKKQ